MNQVVIRVNLDPLDTKTAFPYLGRNLTFNNRYWAAPYINLRKAQRPWWMMAKILEKTGAPVKAHVIVYNVVIQAVLLCGRKIRVFIDVTTKVM